MQAAITKIVSELLKYQELQAEMTGTTSEQLVIQLQQTIEFKQKFEGLIQAKPWILQKCSLHGMILIKECIHRVRDEANEFCQKELAHKINEQKKMLQMASQSINEYKKLFGKPNQLEKGLEQEFEEV